MPRPAPLSQRRGLDPANPLATHREPGADLVRQVRPACSDPEAEPPECFGRVALTKKVRLVGIRVSGLEKESGETA